MSTRTGSGGSRATRAGLALALTIGAAATGSTAAAAPTNTCNSSGAAGGGSRPGNGYSVAVRAVDPGQSCHHGSGPASGDPNQNTDRNYSQLLGPESDSAPCSDICHVSVELADALFDLTAVRQAGGAAAVDVETSGPAVLFATRDGGGRRPACPGYRSTFVDWAQFGFTDPPTGRRYRKTATLTLHRAASRPEARARADAQQICLEAPYRFGTRPGFALAGHDGVFDGVLPDCVGAAAHGPCVVSRKAVQNTGGGWHARVVFALPPNAKDPKALG